MIKVLFAFFILVFATLTFVFFPRKSQESLLRDPKKITIAWEAMPQSLDPRFATDANSHYLSDLLHCSLISFDENGHIQPSLAERYEWLDPKTIRFWLREDFKYSADRPVTAQDVQATYGFFAKKALKNPSPLAQAFAAIESIAAAGNKVTFRLKESDVSFLQNFMIGILPEEIAQKDEVLTVEQGCGAFLLKSNNSQKLELARNPHFSPQPSIETIVIEIVQDEQTRFARLLDQTDSLDLVQNGISRDKLSHLSESYPHLHIISGEALHTSYIGLQMRDPILSDLKVRQALSLAIDREKIVKHVLADTATPAATILIKGDPFYLDSLPDPLYDPSQARTLLAESEHTMPISLTLKTAANTLRTSLLEIIASQLNTVGFNAKVESLDWGRLSDDLKNGRAQAWLTSWIGFKDPDIYRFAFSSAMFPPNGPNRGFFKDEILDGLLEEARQEPRFEKRKALYDEIQRVIAHQLPYIFLWHEKHVAVSKSGWRNFKPYADGRMSSLKTLQFAD